ncbi:YraN family protein [Candidatus Bandiella euplotis]|uniref:UPF0102 protein Bandiella_00371 n=1 Tax=Candidatus Bandiella euplotis TaxID=1664265 RepID=A0ABZ0UKR4_9RICK|nr:YraN family protein [Candidatus Bandiella woodruffii]WPX96262.1 YraN family protein [Candidatus Bandiella woodruffii]
MFIDKIHLFVNLFNNKEFKNAMAQRNLSNYKNGMNAEMVVISHLIRHRYSIIKHRYKTKYGELDIIAARQNVLLFIEVKNRKIIPNYEVISQKQKKRCYDTALHFLANNPQFSNFTMRFDCFFIDAYGEIKHIQNSWEITDLTSNSS